MEGTEKSETSYYSLSYTDSQVTHHVVAIEKVAEQHILTKCSKCNTFQVISHKGIYLWPSSYMQDNREIPATVNEKISDYLRQGGYVFAWDRLSVNKITQKLKDGFR